MEFVTEILAMVEQILAYFKEAEAVAVIDIIKNSLESIFANIALPL